MNPSFMFCPAGATDGTGAECARAFAQHGARVIIHGRNEEKARA
jgi:NAD(P)-dependent dehydrogenase (short-subunit alcohol dehydrogenase family)